MLLDNHAIILLFRNTNCILDNLIPGNINYKDENRISMQDLDLYAPCYSYIGIVLNFGKVVGDQGKILKNI